MRVRYVIPGWEPKPAAGLAEGRPQPYESSFQATLRRLAEPLHIGWESLLRIDQPPQTGLVLAPPPRPEGREPLDAGELRTRWRGLIGRHLRPEADFATPSNPREQSVQAMVALLAEYRDREDAVIARHLMETKV